jgi:hypothetical protein
MSDDFQSLLVEIMTLRRAESKSPPKGRFR